MAQPNTVSKLIGTAIKIESDVKLEMDSAVKMEPTVNTRRKDKSWPSTAKLVHLDRTPCSEECIVSEHFGRKPDFPDDTNETQTDTLANVMPSKNNQTACTSSDMATYEVGVVTEEVDCEGTSVTPNRTGTASGDIDPLPELGSKQDPSTSKTPLVIDLPAGNADEVTLPAINLETEMDDADADDVELDFLNVEDNATLVNIDAAPQTDFAKEMVNVEGIDRDLELELEILAFLNEEIENQADEMTADEKNWEMKRKEKVDKKRDKPVTPEKNKQNTKTQTSESTPRSPKGRWKMTSHSIRRNRGPSHPQNYGCNVCGQLLPSRGELNQHYHNNHPPVSCPVCTKKFNCPNTQDRHIYVHYQNKSFVCDQCGEKFTFESELSNHKIVHQTIKTWPCAKAGCNKEFKWKGDLAVHVKSHTAKFLICTICNNFSTKVEKNLRQHL